MQEQEQNLLSDFVKHAEEFIRTKQELTQMAATEKVVVVGSSLITSLILATLFILAWLFGSVAVALLISDRFGNTYSGFLIVGGFYFLFGFVFFLMRNKWLKTPLMNGMIKVIFKEEQNGQN